ncbi:N-acetylmuramoyl-L-alanine amidase [candidate division KSB1 bacterium]|nr:MAG: N-acetylmuramoyl-L-alanine amidase [candidate division KSB1 bacterium]
MTIRDHLLSGGEGLQHKTSPNHGREFGAGLPDTIILHYTAGSSAESSVEHFMSPSAGASAHLVVGRNGGITQLVPFNVTAWHAGRSEYQGRVGFNQYSIGIEMDNAGPLEKTGGGYTAWFGRVYPESEAVKAVHRNEVQPAYWHCYPEKQISAVLDICILLVDHYGIKTILGHEEISPGRKRDPGPAFPLDKLRDRVLNRDRSLDTEPEPEYTRRSGVVTASSLNVRFAPNVAAPTVLPRLSQGTVLDVLREAQGWYEVAVAVRGWVKKDYVQV